MQTASYVDINKFMGDWHVLANIPTFPERGAINPIERYALNKDGTVDTTFSFISPKNGTEKVLKATGYVQPDTNNAVWGMQFIWPIKADYRVVYLDPEYQTTIIGRKKRDYLWIMSRDPICRGRPSKCWSTWPFGWATTGDRSSFQNGERVFLPPASVLVIQLYKTLVLTVLDTEYPL